MTFAAHSVPDREEMEEAQARAAGERMAWRRLKNRDSYAAPVLPAELKRVKGTEAKGLFAQIHEAIDAAVAS